MATKCGNFIEHLECTVGEMSATVERNDIAKDDFGGSKAGFLLQLVKDLVHLVEHFGAAELGDDEVVGKERVAERLFGLRS